MRRTQSLGVLIRLGCVPGVGIESWGGERRGESKAGQLSQAESMRLILSRVWSYLICLHLPSNVHKTGEHVSISVSWGVLSWEG